MGSATGWYFVLFIHVSIPNSHHVLFIQAGSRLCASKFQVNRGDSEVASFPGFCFLKSQTRERAELGWGGVGWGRRR